MAPTTGRPDVGGVAGMEDEGGGESSLGGHGRLHQQAQGIGGESGVVVGEEDVVCTLFEGVTYADVGRGGEAEVVASGDLFDMGKVGGYGRWGATGRTIVNDEEAEGLVSLLGAGGEEGQRVPGLVPIEGDDVDEGLGHVLRIQGRTISSAKSKAGTGILV